MAKNTNEIVKQSIAPFVPTATSLTSQHFCFDCEKKADGCFPCKNAQVMIQVYLCVVIQEAAKTN